MRTILLSLLISVFTITNAQSPTWLWAENGSPSSADYSYGNSTCTDASGNVYVAGYFTGTNITFGTYTLTNLQSGYGDIFLVKYDPTGNVLWARRAGGIYDDIGRGIAMDGSGNVLITGNFSGNNATFSTITLTNTGNSNAFIAKYDASGNIVWAKAPTGGNYDDRGYSVTSDASDNVYVTGLFSSDNITFGTTILNNANNTATDDIFIVKYGPGGNLIWAKSNGGTGGDDGQSISVDGSGNVLVTGVFSSPTISFGSTVLTNSGGLDVFTAKYDGSGNPVWAKNALGTSTERSYGVSTDASGNVYITGYFFSSSVMFGTYTLTNTNSSYEDVFVVKYNSAGTVQWAKSAAGPYTDMGRSITTDTNSNVYVAGYFRSSPSITFGTYSLTNVNPGYDDIFVVKYNSSGTVLWATNAGGTDTERAYGVCADNNGNINISGSYRSSSLSFGSNAILNSTGSDAAFIARLNQYTGIKENSGLSGSISVFPNPSTGKFNFMINSKFLSNETENLEIFNTLGESVYKNTIRGENTLIDISNESKGVYFYQFKRNDLVLQKGKMIID